MVHLYKGWGDIGFDFLMIDAISPHAYDDGTALTWLRYIERECGVRTIGEAYPQRKGRFRKVIDQESIDQHAWLGHKRFVDRYPTIKGHPTGARYMAFNGHAKGWKAGHAKRLEMISAAIEQGFIPDIYDIGRPPENVELFKHAVDELAKHDAAAR